MDFENEQIKQFLINPTLDYYEQHFQKGPYQTGGGMGWKNLWDRIQNDHAACL